MRWSLKPKPDHDKVSSLQEALKIDHILASLLVQRGIETYDDARMFFRPELSHLHDPYLMQDMEKAVARIEKAIYEDENIMVYGDYDVDGTTAVAMMTSFLRKDHDRVTTYIPDRYEEGYGISFKGIDYAHDNDISLIIALDCGIKAIDKIDYALKKGIDFIICDHHRPGDAIPKATAVLNPKRPDCAYPFKELCGCGVGFKLIQALAANQGLTIDDLTSLLDLVAIAIAADIVPIIGENRILAFYGLQLINELPRPGILAILDQKKKPYYNTTDLVFIIAPRINAAGRMKHGQHAVDLLLENDTEQARSTAQEIDGFNAERKMQDKEITRQALAQIEDNEEQEDYSTMVYDPDWHKGVLGIVASRLIETYYRPTIVLTKSGDGLTGSARSVKGFDVYQALEKCSIYLEQFGGHKYAAGMSLKVENYDKFKEAFEKVVKENIKDHQRVQELTIDLKIDLNMVSPRLFRILSQFGPFGPGNMRPVFMSSDLTDSGYARLVGEEGRHLKLTVHQGRNNGALQAIGFNLGKRLELIKDSKPFKAAFTIDENHWNGRTDLQLKIRDIKPC